MIIPIATRHKRMKVTLSLQAKKPTSIRIVGECDTHPSSVYVNRLVHFGQAGERKEINIPFPLSPERLNLKVMDKNSLQNIQLENVRLAALPPRAIWEYPDIHNFIPFANWFSKNSGTLPIGDYRNESNRFNPSDPAYHRIEYYPVIRDQTGKPLTTPARTSRDTGLIQVSQYHFKPLSIPVRWFILMHERKHFQIPTRSEKEADLGALRVFLDYGFPKIEAIYACTKAMEANTSLAKQFKLKRLKDIHHFIDQYIAHTE